MPHKPSAHALLPWPAVTTGQSNWKLNKQAFSPTDVKLKAVWSNGGSGDWSSVLHVRVYLAGGRGCSYSSIRGGGWALHRLPSCPWQTSVSGKLRSLFCCPWWLLLHSGRLLPTMFKWDQYRRLEASGSMTFHVKNKVTGRKCVNEQARC